MDSNHNIILPDEVIMSKIFLIRGKKVMIDQDLADLYKVETRTLKQQVKRNIERFPEDFMFELTRDEFNNLRSQFVISSWGGLRYMPMAFTEQGVAMLSSILNSKQAIYVNIKIIRVFTKMRELMYTHKEILQKLEQLEKKDTEQDKKILLIFKYLNHLKKARQDVLNNKNRRKIGFKREKDKS